MPILASTPTPTPTPTRMSASPTAASFSPAKATATHQPEPASAPSPTPPGTPSTQPPSVKAGFFKTATEADGTPVASIAAVQEFGAVVQGRGGHPIVIPPRPFLRQTIARCRNAWVRQLADALRVSLRTRAGTSSGGAGATQSSSESLQNFNTFLRTLTARASTSQALTAVGHSMQADITDTIRQTHTPPNAPSTVRHKGFDNPLVETGTLQNSVSFQVDA
ncbi:hypothetical protein [Acetobacter persici]|uniref:hypothetical protein n=1 Tax=Acetobacter persici TaxID=1076596 RepID=UPI001BA8AEE6|nr:hypothetical protein [Acetobacter persici]MBS0964099.1 hypothetical protein [Acetobacter persici]